MVKIENRTSRKLWFSVYRNEEDEVIVKVLDEMPAYDVLVDVDDAIEIRALEVLPKVPPVSDNPGFHAGAAEKEVVFDPSIDEINEDIKNFKAYNEKIEADKFDALSYHTEQILPKQSNLSMEEVHSIKNLKNYRHPKDYESTRRDFDPSKTVNFMRKTGNFMRFGALYKPPPKK